MIEQKINVYSENKKAFSFIFKVMEHYASRYGHLYNIKNKEYMFISVFIYFWLFLPSGKQLKWMSRDMPCKVPGGQEVLPGALFSCKTQA